MAGGRLRGGWGEYQRAFETTTLQTEAQGQYDERSAHRVHDKQNEPTSYQGKIMTETEFNQLVDATLLKIESAVDASGADLDYENAAGILTLEFEDGSKIIINRQGPTQEIWVAAKSGGYHYRWDGAAWHNTRDGSALFQSLSQYASQQAGEEIKLG